MCNRSPENGILGNWDFSAGHISERGLSGLRLVRNLHSTGVRKMQSELYLVNVSVERTLAKVSLSAELDGLEIVSTSVSLSGT
jgi:hypothetical protein